MTVPFPAPLGPEMTIKLPISFDLITKTPPLSLHYNIIFGKVQSLLELVSIGFFFFFCFYLIHLNSLSFYFIPLFFNLFIEKTPSTTDRQINRKRHDDS